MASGVEPRLVNGLGSAAGWARGAWRQMISLHALALRAAEFTGQEAADGSFVPRCGDERWMNIHPGELAPGLEPGGSPCAAKRQPPSVLSSQPDSASGGSASTPACWRRDVSLAARRERDRRERRGLVARCRGVCSSRGGHVRSRWLRTGLGRPRGRGGPLRGGERRAGGRAPADALAQGGKRTPPRARAREGPRGPSLSSS